MIMIVRIASTYDDSSAREMYDRFMEEGSCPFGDEKVAMGLVKEAKGGPVGYVFTVELASPLLNRMA
jgi:hypothetical protein